MGRQKCEIGMVGLGTMGRSLLLNIADHGFSAAGYDKDLSKVRQLKSEARSRNVQGAESLVELVGTLRSPRVVMLLLPAGVAVDQALRELLPYLANGDVVMDGGNSYFKDTVLRGKLLAEKGVSFLGVGVSGGEQGARHGPSLMPGGSKEAYQRVRALLESIAAQVDGEPCVAYLGPGSAGHYVKMVHNGIEYGLMQLIAESYDLMKRGLHLTDDELHDVYARWNQTELRAFLLEITAHIFRKLDAKTGKRLIDVILDEASQKGTGKWTIQEAAELQVSVPNIDVAVAMRDLSANKRERLSASRVLKRARRSSREQRAAFLLKLRHALYAGMIITYAQGLVLLRVASRTYDYGLNLEEVARIWRGGCIIRAALLDKIWEAYRTDANLPNPLLDTHLASELMARQAGLRSTVRSAAELGIPVPALMVSLAYFDSYRSIWLPANLIQAQRDYFGDHTYHRLDSEGIFHTQWTQG